MIVPDQSTDPSSYMDAGTTQWMSPELLDPGRFNLTEGRRTKESDCYALGMVIYEILSGQAPFAPLRPPPVIWRVLEGLRPGRPEGTVRVLFTDDIWKTLELCWKHQPGERINAKIVLQRLEKASPLPRLHFNTNEIKETGAGERSDATASGSGMFSPFCRRFQAELQSHLWYNRSDDYTS